MIEDGDREHLLGMVLTGDVVVEDFADLLSGLEHRRKSINALLPCGH